MYNSSGPLGPDNTSPLTGLFYGGGVQVLAAQAVGSAIVTSSTFVVTLVMMYAINAFGLLRVSEEGEVMGLDLYEHGVPAYPEYSLHPSATPQGATSFHQSASAVSSTSPASLRERASHS
jgi:Amt family ammonium transporter